MRARQDDPRLTTLLAIAPILLVFLFSQRALVSGMLAGATKE
jgi:multiple sugar transport system permease protein